MKLYFTQIDPPETALFQRLEAKGWMPQHLPFRQVEFCGESLVLGDFDALVLTSKQAARWLLQQPRQALPPLAVVGTASAALLAGHDLLIADPPGNAADLAGAIRTRLPTSARILFLRGETAKTTIPLALNDYHLTCHTVYRTRKIQQKVRAIEDPSMVYFQAPSTVADFVEHFAQPPSWIAAIGASTAGTLRQLGWRIDFQPSRPENRFFVAELPQPGRISSASRPPDKGQANL
jgi:uroporphyrinogen-III synthase